MSSTSRQCQQNDCGSTYPCHVEGWYPGGTQNSMVTSVEPSASDPVLIVVQVSVRLIIHVPSVTVVSVICVAVNPVTVPISVLFPGEGERGRGVAAGRGLGVGRATAGVAVLVTVAGAQLTRITALARMQT